MLNVVLASDDNYANILLISLTSLLEHNADAFSAISVFILDDGLSDYNRNIISLLTEKYPCQISFIKTENLNSYDIDFQTMDRDVAVEGVKSLTPYARLFMGSLLPKDVKRVLYVDCDSLTVGSYRDLWDMNIDDWYCAAVIDSRVNEYEKNQLGWKLDEPYINSGFMLANLEKWREDNLERKFIKYLFENQGKTIFWDQDAVNFVLKDKIKFIEPKYNLQFFFQYCDYEMAKFLLKIKGEYYSKETVVESQKNPIFVHFCGFVHDRPWQTEYHPWRGEYEKYALLADCGEVMQNLDIPLYRKILYTLFKSRIYRIFSHLF
jgi:lipopolysaccharide biosynthesis glycosyltransferase